VAAHAAAAANDAGRDAGSDVGSAHSLDVPAAADPPCPPAREAASTAAAGHRPAGAEAPAEGLRRRGERDPRPGP
jgi:hypothetical protein